MNKSIVYYISDHGFGHATRSLAIIRALCREQPNLKILIRTSRNVKFMKKALINEIVYVYKGENDFGLIEGRKLSISPEKTQIAFEKWVLTWDKWLREEQNRHINKVDLVISDICPQPFLLAEKLGIPSIAISNFTWLDQYRELFESDSLIDLGQAYRAASSCLVL
ncbi:MAG: glycosyltransferase family protein, partial [Candidatus Hodarchaeales archaeon]